MSQPLPDWLVVSPVAALAGAIGAIVSLRALDDLTPRGRVLAVLGGFACSVFLTGLIVDGLHEWTGWKVWLSVRAEAGVAFTIGLCGLYAAGETIKLFPSVRAWAARWLGDRNGSGGGHGQ